MSFLNRLFLRASAGGTQELTWTAPIDIQAADEGGEGDDRGPTFSVHAYTGAPMRPLGLYMPVVLDLSGQRKTRGQVKALRNHDSSRILGHATKVDVNDKGIFVDGMFSGSDAEITQVIEPSKRGFQWEASIGANAERMERLEAGKTATVNGRTVTGPLFIARQWALKEVSFVAIGADENTTTSIAAEGSGDDTMNFEQWIKAHGFEPGTITDQFKQTLRAQYDAELQAAGGDASKLNVPRGGESNNQSNGQSNGQQQNVTATGSASNSGGANASGQLNANGNLDFTAALDQFRQDQVRVERIRAICQEHGNPTMEVNGAQTDLCAHAIGNGLSIDEVELQCLRGSRPQAPTGIVRGDMDTSLQASALEASLCRSAGLGSDFIEKQFDERSLHAADHRDLRGAGLQQLIHMCVQANGGYAVPGRMDLETIQAAMRTDPMLNGSGINASGMGGQGGYSTLSLSGILSNLANKAMLERFGMIESVIPEIFYETDTNDFKPFKRFRLHADGQFTEVGSDGDLKSISLQEQEFTNQLKTYGGSLSLTRVHITNDDLQAFLEIFRLFAELAMHAREETALRMLLSNPGSFFSSGKGNYMDGANSALSHASLSSAVTSFRKMKDPNGKFIMVRPSLLLVPPSLETTAEELFTSLELRGQSTKGGTRNTHHNKYKPIVSPHIGADALTGGSDLSWYLAASPATSRAMAQVAYLRGRRTPTVESATAKFSSGGIEWASYWDFGTAMQDQEAAVKSKGEA